MPNVIGTWRLVRTEAKDAAGNALPAPYGGRAMGRVVLEANGRMMAVVCDWATELPPRRQAGIQFLLRQLHLRRHHPGHQGRRGL